MLIQTRQPTFMHRYYGVMSRSVNSMSYSLAPIADLALKLWVANVFFKSGLNKFESFDSTVMLFTYEYNVALLSPYAAAWLGTAVELVFPVLLVLGLMGRFSAAVLFIFNIVAAISYPDISEAGIRDHVLWGIMLLVIMTNRPHSLTLDFHLSRVIKSDFTNK